VARACGRNFADLGRSYRDISLRRLRASPLARSNAKFEFAVYPASLWLEAHNWRPGLAGGFRSADYVACERVLYRRSNRWRHPIARWDQARASAEKLDWPAAVRSIAEAGKQIASLENQVKQSQDSRAANAVWELDQVRERINHALADAARNQIVSNSDRSELVAGEGFNVRAEVTHRADAQAIFSKPSLTLPSGWSITKQEEKDGTIISALRFPWGRRRRTRRETGCIRSRRRWSTPARTLRWKANAFDFSAPVTSLHANTVSVLSYPLRLFPPSRSRRAGTVRCG